MTTVRDEVLSLSSSTQCRAGPACGGPECQPFQVRNLYSRAGRVKSAHTSASSCWPAGRAKSSCWTICRSDRSKPASAAGGCAVQLRARRRIAPERVVRPGGTGRRCVPCRRHHGHHDKAIARCAGGMAVSNICPVAEFKRPYDAPSTNDASTIMTTDGTAARPRPIADPTKLSCVARTAPSCTMTDPAISDASSPPGTRGSPMPPPEIPGRRCLPPSPA